MLKLPAEIGGLPAMAALICCYAMSVPIIDAGVLVDVTPEGVENAGQRTRFDRAAYNSIRRPPQFWASQSCN
jgi:hypothetical protein